MNTAQLIVDVHHIFVEWMTETHGYLIPHSVCIQQHTISNALHIALWLSWL